MANNRIKKDLEKEIFFLDPTEEYKYFCARIKSISNYSNEFFKQQAVAELVSRYIRAIASIQEGWESESLKEVYKDCLIQLGMDDYCIATEIENYKLTHATKQENIMVSKKSRK